MDNFYSPGMLSQNMGDLPVPHDNGMWINEKISRLVELIRNYDNHLDVKIIPDHLLQMGDAKFAITERLADGREVVAFYVQSEAEFDESVLARIYEADNTKHDVQSAMESHNKAQRALKQKEYEDQMQQAHDEAAFLWKTPKHTVRLGGKTLHL